MSELPEDFATATHTVLFEQESTPRCDVCADPLGGAADEGYDVHGRGLLLWTRGDERRYQEPPLCPTCAAAIGLSALQRWEIEEEEG